jgi:hypothetical protein
MGIKFSNTQEEVLKKKWEPRLGMVCILLVKRRKAKTRGGQH